MVNEFLTKGAALVGVFHGFFVADAGEANALDYYADAFVVEVCHYDWDLLVIDNGMKRVERDIPLKPWFSFPIRFSTGTLTSSNVT